MKTVARRELDGVVCGGHSEPKWKIAKVNIIQLASIDSHFPLFISLNLRSHLLEYFICLNYLLIVYPFMWKSPIWSDLKRELFKWPRPLVFGSFQSPSATYTGPEDLPTQGVWHGSDSYINTFYLPILFRGVFYSQFLILLHLRPFILSFLFISASDLLLSCLLSARDSDGCRRLLFSP